MIPGVNPKQMQKMMKQMGMKQEDIPAERVEIFLTGGIKLVFDDPTVQKVDMMGQENYQVSGEARVEDQDTTPEISEEDINTVVEQTGVSAEEARAAIENAQGDLAEAILNLSQ